MSGKKFTTYLDQSHIDWLKETALQETKKRGHEVTAARLIREMINEKMRKEKYNASKNTN
jgi:hypothetical protein